MAKQAKTNTEFTKMGTEAAYAQNASGAPSPNTKPVPRKNTQSGGEGATASHRIGTLERNGFQGAPQVSYSYQNAPEASSVGRNVRLFAPAKGNRDFYARRAYGQGI